MHLVSATESRVVSFRRSRAHSTRMDVQRTARSRRLAWLTLAVMLLVAAGCGGGHTRDSDRVASVSARSWLADTSPGSEARPVLAAARGFWATYTAVTGEPFDAVAIGAKADSVATGPEEDALVGAARRNAVAGVVVRGSVVSHPRLVTITGTEATVVDCVDDQSGVYRADGSRVDAEDPRPHRVVMRLTRTSMGWRVARVGGEERACDWG